MNELIRTTAVSIMDRIMKHPIANDYIEPILPGDGTESEYFEKIKNPQDLSSIRQRLIDGRYQTLQNWLDDVETVWKNAELYHGPQSHYASISQQCRKIFDKEKRALDVLSMGTWCGEVYRLRSRVYDLMGQPPTRVKQYASSLGSSHTMKQNMPLLTEREVQNFIAASEMLQMEEDHAEMIRIIDEMQPEIDPGKEELWLDVTKLSLPTIYALREYMRNSLEKRGQKYPE